MVREYFTCREMVELVTDYLEGAMPPPARAEFERHLSVCPGCISYFEQIRETIRALGKITDDAIPPAAREELLELFRRLRDG
ncbi:MAG TPA: zf-HC2 domain-containing protein [Roseiflexaceae bacterium]|nr:zf-HC2 domain-containing protein [Roseiflexaceae bacterium]